MALQIRRGTDAERQVITPKIGEPIYTTDQKELYIGDGTTQGGILISGTLVNEETPLLGADLNLNGNDIVGTGNINIDGTITATGNINLGDAADDNVIVGGQIGSSLIPNAGSTYDLGASGTTWSNIFSDTVTATNLSGSLTGDVNGSVFADDSSTVLVDATNSTLGGSLLGNVRTSDNSEVILDTSSKVLNVNNINMGVADDGASINASDNLVFIAPTNTFLTGSDPTANDPFFRTIAFHNSTQANEIAGLRARGSFLSPVQLQDGDEVINFSMLALSASGTEDYINTGSVKGIVNYDGSNYSGKWELTTRKTDGSFATGLEVDTVGIKTNQISSYDTGSVDFISPPKLPVFADATARDAAITSPSAGMMILVGSQFQGYDGTSWVAIS